MADNKPEEYLGVSGPLKFLGKEYHLGWSSHPTAIYYKQEYVLNGEQPDHFSSMILLEVVKHDASPGDAISALVQLLERRMDHDSAADYETVDANSPGEKLFVFSLGEHDGPAGPILEWNAYRYMSLTLHNGEKALMVLAYSRRAYSRERKPFFDNIERSKKAIIAELAGYKLPDLKL